MVLPNRTFVPTDVVPSMYISRLAAHVPVLIDRRLKLQVPVVMWEHVRLFLSKRDAKSFDHRMAIMNEVAMSATVFADALHTSGDTDEDLAVLAKKEMVKLNRFLTVVYHRQIRKVR